MQNRLSYQQLQPEDRMTIASMRQQDCSVRAMARTLRRSASTISRELGRNTVGAQAYGSPRANMTCDTYPREISEQRGRYDDQPSTQGSDARSEQFVRFGRIARSPEGD